MHTETPIKRSREQLQARPNRMTAHKTSSAAKKKKACCSESTHPDHTPVLNRLRRLQGQLSGIEKMIVDRRYCVDIITQFRASKAALKAIEATVLETHLRSCVRDAIESKDSRAAETKIQELMLLMRQS